MLKCFYIYIYLKGEASVMFPANACRPSQWAQPFTSWLLGLLTDWLGMEYFHWMTFGHLYFYWFVFVFVLFCLVFGWFRAPFCFLPLRFRIYPHCLSLWFALLYCWYFNRMPCRSYDFIYTDFMADTRRCGTHHIAGAHFSLWWT